MKETIITTLGFIWEIGTLSMFIALIKQINKGNLYTFRDVIILVCGWFLGFFPGILALLYK